MRKLLTRLTAGFLILLVAGSLGYLLFFQFAQHHVAENMHAPHLEVRPQPTSDMVFRTLDGQTRHLADTKGKVVFLDLWGTWCIQCVAEMPSVQKLYDHYKNDPQVEFLIVSRMDSPATVRSYASRHHFDLPFFVTHDDDIPAAMQLHQFPSTFIYAKNGQLVAEHTAAADWSSGSVIAFLDDLKAR